MESAEQTFSPSRDSSLSYSSEVPKTPFLRVELLLLLDFDTSWSSSWTFGVCINKPRGNCSLHCACLCLLGFLQDNYFVQVEN
ncbi:hypothetical protein J5N97_019298 [Dioscorea zingiberensis]|uniref:Uncharacterized protein n=1 Tax=Dioscorea zingiberensis TaxID=325984 RepID=A0A9D5CEC1_9LILI|nr:hypothetical protein J5N97_019298 [Dioscorea zingiberensis]